MFIGLILVLIIIYFLYREKGQDIFNNNSNNKSLQKLNEKYIDGEISKEEYVKMKEVIKK